MPASSGIWWPLLLSTLAGLSTAVGGLMAVSFNSNPSTLAFLLGTAIGVMTTVSCIELWWHSAVQLQDWLGVTVAVAVGAAAFALLDPLLPQHHEQHTLLPTHETTVAERSEAVGVHAEAASVSSSSSRVTVVGMPGDIAAGGSRDQLQQHRQEEQQQQQQQQSSRQQTPPESFTVVDTASGSSMPDLEMQIGEAPLLPKLRAISSSTSSRGKWSTEASAVDATVPWRQQQQQQQQQGAVIEPTTATVDSQHAQSVTGDVSFQSSNASNLHRAGLLRLALVMALTMTLHNLPEGCAVAFSAYTGIGPVMAVAIALHNIPEGLVIAAPLFAATGSRSKALGLALASGISEPLGALVSLLLLKPFVTSAKQLDYVLAGTGGVMLAVCVLELWPEGRRCERGKMLAGGLLLGAVVMAWTLWVGA